MDEDPLAALFEEQRGRLRAVRRSPTTASRRSAVCSRSAGRGGGSRVRVRVRRAERPGRCVSGRPDPALAQHARTHDVGVPRRRLGREPLSGPGSGRPCRRRLGPGRRPRAAARARPADRVPPAALRRRGLLAGHRGPGPGTGPGGGPCRPGPGPVRRHRGPPLGSGRSARLFRDAARLPVRTRVRVGTRQDEPFRVLPPPIADLVGWPAPTG